MSNADTDPFWGDPFWGDDGYVALKLIVKNPGTPLGHCNQIVAWVRNDEVVDLERPIGEDPLLRGVLMELLERTMRTPPSK